MFRRDKLVSRTLSVLLSAIVAAPAAISEVAFLLWLIVRGGNARDEVALATA